MEIKINTDSLSNYDLINILLFIEDSKFLTGI